MPVTETLVRIPVGDVELQGDLRVPPDAQGVVVFSHGSGSGRHSPRNNAVAEDLRERGLATLLLDLLTEEEDRVRANRFDIPLLTERLADTLAWVRERDEVAEVAELPAGVFGASTGAASALRVAARPEANVGAVVSRGGRVDLAEDALPSVTCPTLFIVGGEDAPVLHLNQHALRQLGGARELEVVEGAGHLFGGPGELEEVSRLAGAWFQQHLG